MKIFLALLAVIWILAFVMSLTSCSVSIDERGKITHEVDPVAVNRALNKASEKIIRATK